MTDLPNTNVGIPSFETEAFTMSHALSGAGPTYASPEEAADNTVLAALTVVGRVGNLPTGKIVIATTGNTDPDDDVVPIGILVDRVVDVGATQGCAVYRDGTWNPAALIWDASFATDALKLHAFEDVRVPSDTKIHLRTPVTATP